MGPVLWDQSVNDQHGTFLRPQTHCVQLVGTEGLSDGCADPRWGWRPGQPGPNWVLRKEKSREPASKRSSFIQLQTTLSDKDGKKIPDKKKTPVPSEADPRAELQNEGLGNLYILILQKRLCFLCWFVVNDHIIWYSYNLGIKQHNHVSMIKLILALRPWILRDSFEK